MNPDNAGWKTTEFWLSLAAVIVSFILAQDLGDNTWVTNVLAIAATVLASFGYTMGRSSVKKAKISANGKN